ncbi:MAG: hypothetical protein H6726_27175 [Sandaracinaceae bacterium]|nr:hypothetical protein [Sandaracinaceae bacterium]
MGAALAALRWKRTRSALVPVSLLLGALPVVAAAGMSAQEAAQLTLAPDTNLAAADVTSRGPMATMLLCILHERLFVGQAVTAVGLALVGTALALQSRRPASEDAPRPGSLALVWAACALTSVVAAYAAGQRTVLLDALAVAPPGAYLAALLDAADAREHLQWLRTVFAAIAVLLALRATATTRGTLRERVATGAALLLGVAALQTDVAAEGVATSRVASTFATPWTDDASFEPIVTADLTTELSLGYPYTEVAVVLGTDGPRDYIRGIALPREVPALTEALGALRERLAQERADVAEAYEAREVQEEPPLEMDSDGANEMAAPADAMGRVVARAAWTRCAPASEEHTLAVAVDRRATADALRVMVEAATSAGFGRLELVVPANDPIETRALHARDTTGGALVGHAMHALQWLLVARCVAGDVPFMTGVVTDVPLRTLRRSDGSDAPVGDPPGLDALPDLPPDLPTVVLALGENATPIALLQATQDMLERMVSDTPLLVSSPALLPAPPPARASGPAAVDEAEEATAESAAEPAAE